MLAKKGSERWHRSCHLERVALLPCWRFPKGILPLVTSLWFFLSYKNSPAHKFKLFFPPAFLLISSMWKRKHKDVSKMENTFPSANQTSKHICSWKTRKLGFCTKPKRCSSDSFNSLLPNLRSLNLSGDFKSILEAWQKILPISLPSKIHTLQVPEAEEAQGGRHSLRHHTKHHSTKKTWQKPNQTTTTKNQPQTHHKNKLSLHFAQTSCI